MGFGIIVVIAVAGIIFLAMAQTVRDRGKGKK